VSEKHEESSKHEIRNKFKSQNEHQIQNESLRVPGFGFSEFEMFLTAFVLDLVLWI